MASSAFCVASFVSCSALQFFVCGVSSSSMSTVIVMGFSPCISMSMFRVRILFCWTFVLMWFRAAFSA